VFNLPRLNLAGRIRCGNSHANSRAAKSSYISLPEGKLMLASN